MLRSGVNKGCGGCARLRRLAVVQPHQQPQLQQQQRRQLRTLLSGGNSGGSSGPQPTLGGSSAAAASHEGPSPSLLLGQQPRRGLAAAARKVLEGAGAGAAVDPAAKGKGKGGGRDATPTRRGRVASRSIQARAAAAEVGGAGGGMGMPSSGIGAREQAERERYRERLQQMMDGLEGHIAQCEKAFEEVEEIGEDFDPSSSMEQEQHHRRMLDAAAAEQQRGVPPSFVMPNELLGGPVVETSRERLLRMEGEFERGTVDEALQEYKKVQATLFSSGKAANLPVVKRQIFAWCVFCGFGGGGWRPAGRQSLLVSHHVSHVSARRFTLSYPSKIKQVRPRDPRDGGAAASAEAGAVGGAGPRRGHLRPVPLAGGPGQAGGPGHPRGGEHGGEERQHGRAPRVAADQHGRGGAHGGA